MEEIEKLLTLYRLKNVARSSSVQSRKESSAEHSWSCLVLADYFLSKMALNTGKTPLDRMKVYEMLIYHDLIEIETGDVCITKKTEEKEKKEKAALPLLVKKIPPKLVGKFLKLFQEFEERKTKEARFAKAIDALDTVLQELDCKEDWKGWTEEFLRKKKEHLLMDFPELMTMFEKILQHAREQGYFH